MVEANSDYVNCGNTELGLPEWLISLLAKDSNGCAGLRVKLYTEGVVDCKPITCSGEEDFLTLLKQSIEVGCDGKRVLRVYATTHRCNTTDIIGCGEVLPILDLFKLTFVEITGVGKALYILTEPNEH
jgi:hypothetical protein